MMGYYEALRMGYFGIWVILATGNFIRGGVPLLKANGYYRL